ncbi:MAG TPA: hypothetical protein VF753_16910 [Terriglobales bacterium]
MKGSVEHGAPETVNVDYAIDALRRLQADNSYGAPRLEQAFGKSGAKNLLRDMYAAQRIGVDSLTTQQFAKLLAKYAGVPAVGGALYAGYQALSGK